MFAYKNTSSIAKTFYGVTFKPGEVKEVRGYINDPKFIRVPAVPKEPPKPAAKGATSAPKSTQHETPKEDPRETQATVSDNKTTGGNTENG